MGTQLEAAAHKLLDFSQPTDVAVLDATVTTFYEAPSPEEVSFLFLRVAFIDAAGLNTRLRA